MLVPLELRNKITYKKYYKKDLIYSNDSNKVLYIISGVSYIVKYDDQGEIIFPYIITPDEFLGINNLLGSSFGSWEVIIDSMSAEVYEIPKDIFNKYILPSPIFLESYLEKSSNVITHIAKAFYIYNQGGAVAYFAFFLEYIFTKFNLFTLKRYPDLTKVLCISKATLYNITNKFIEEGVVIKEKNELILLDKKKLKTYFEDFIE